MEMLRESGMQSDWHADFENVKAYLKLAQTQDVDYDQISGLRIEARQKLSRQQPTTLGQASRIPGVSPADIAVLTVWLARNERSGQA